MQEKYPTRQNNQNNPYVSSGASFASQYWGGGGGCSNEGLISNIQKSEWAEVWIARSPVETWDDQDLQRSRVWPDSRKSGLPEVQIFDLMNFKGGLSPPLPTGLASLCQLFVYFWKWLLGTELRTVSMVN